MSVPNVLLRKGGGGSPQPSGFICGESECHDNPLNMRWSVEHPCGTKKVTRGVPSLPRPSPGAGSFVQRGSRRWCRRSMGPTGVRPRRPEDKKHGPKRRFNNDNTVASAPNQRTLLTVNMRTPLISHKFKRINASS